MTEKSDHPLDSALKLDTISLLKILRADAEVRAAKSELSLRSVLLEETIRRIDPTDSIRQHQSGLRHQNAVCTAKSAEYKAVLDEIGERLGIDMADYSYDDETGVLHEIPKDSSPRDAATPSSQPKT